MIALSYTLELLEPFLATGLEGDPNTKQSLDYVPGSMLRGAVIYRYLHQTSHSELDPEAPTDSRLFLKETTRYLNAYPLTANGKRSLPTPASWLRLKGKSLTANPQIFDCAVDANQLPDQQLETIGSPFCYLDDRRVYLYRPERRISVHTAREPKAGRATQDKGAVFQYDALAPGQKFGGVILTSLAADAEQLKALLTQGPPLRLGGSRSAGYGLVQSSDVKIVDEWHETDAEISDIDQGEYLILTCLSPCIVRDNFGNLCADLDASQVAECLGIAANSLRPELKQTRRSIATLGGFNRHWGLPLCQTQTIAAGSVFVYTTIEPVSVSRLLALQEVGIGERRNEGFGRLAVNWQKAETVSYQEQEPRPSILRPPAPIIEGPNESLARRMAERLLRQELERNLAECVQRLRLTESNLKRDVPRNSQLSGVRMIVRSALASGDLERVRDFMAEMKKTARDQFMDARLHTGNQRLYEWIMMRLEHPEQIWAEIKPPAQFSFGALTVEVSAAWNTEYTLRLIDGVLAQAAKDKRQGWKQ